MEALWNPRKNEKVYLLALLFYLYIQSKPFPEQPGIRREKNKYLEKLEKTGNRFDMDGEKREDRSNARHEDESKADSKQTKSKSLMFYAFLYLIQNLFFPVNLIFRVIFKVS